MRSQSTAVHNPCFVSPFHDAGYDISDYLTVAPRYGSADDLAKLVDEARRRGIRVLLDLVAGHTSVEHPWFRASADDPDDHRYIWAPEGRPEGFVTSPGARPGSYLPNFFAFQPALNLGCARENPGEPWRQPLGRAGATEEMAPLVVYLLSDESAYVNGAEITVDGGYAAHGGVKAITNALDGR